MKIDFFTFFLIQVLLLMMYTILTDCIFSAYMLTLGSPCVLLLFLSSVLLGILNDEIYSSLYNGIISIVLLLLLFLALKVTVTISLDNLIIVALGNGFLAFIGSLLRRAFRRNPQKPNFLVCPFCGAKFKSNPIYCTQCGKRIRDPIKDIQR